MPEIGEVKKGREIGHTNLRLWFRWIACEDCGKERWVRLRKSMPDSMRCRSCGLKRNRYKDHEHGNSERHWNWKGGEIIADGYRFVMMKAHPRADKRGYVREHIVVLEQKLGRPLKPSEITHHLNGIRNDNRPENLVAMPRKRHNLKSAFVPYEERIKELEFQNARLQAEINGSRT